jgi:hypothetical protein
MNSSQSNLLSEELNTPTMDEGFIDPELMLEQTLADPNLVQHIVRSNQDGIESIVGYFRCEFLAGQQRYVLHAPFSPALGAVPAIEAMVADEECLQDSVRVRVTDKQKFGARLEVVLVEPAKKPISLLVEVIASAAAKSSSSAIRVSSVKPIEPA